MDIWNQLIIDVECMGTEADSALVAVGAAFFDLHRFEIGPKFVRPIHLATSVRLGMKMYPETVLWWLRQSEQARSAVMYGLVDINVAFDDFNAFCAAHSRRKDVRVWGNSSRFDLGIMAHGYKLAGKELPWTYGKETCFRTVRNMNTHVPYDASTQEGTHHNAIDDCVHEIEHLFKIRRFNLEHRPLVMPR